MYLYFLIIISIIITIISAIFYQYIFKVQTHHFWDIQPVSRLQSDNSPNDSIIIKPKFVYVNYKTKLENSFDWDVIRNINAFTLFLKNNFAKFEIYSPNYINWILNSPSNHIYKLKNISREKFNICLLKNRNFIGSIIGKPIILNIKNKILDSLYIDFLCIEKKYRNQNIAPKLMYKIIDIWKNTRLDINIFRIDNKPLPFHYIAEFSYYYYLLNDSKDGNFFKNKFEIRRLDQSNIHQTYNFFTSRIKKYKLYQIFTLHEFQYYFLPNSFVETFITFDKNGEINSFTSFLKTNYFFNNQILKAAELQYFIFDDIHLIYKFINYFRETRFDMLIFLDNMSNNQLINLLNPIVGHKTYLHLYNYHTTIQKNEIAFI